MTEDEFVQRVFVIAEHAELKVEGRRPGKSICFIPTSNKWLNEDHLRSLFPLVLDPKLSDAQINQMIEDAAPGRPCTHKGFRAILKQLHSEFGWVPGSSV